MSAVRILVVDDTEANRVAFQAVLGGLGEILAVGSGPEALRAAREQRFAVIIMDVRMPGMGGLETAEILRKTETSRSTPIIFTSAYDTSVMDATRGYKAGATDYVASPVDADILRFKVAAFVDLHLAHERARRKIEEMAEIIRNLRTQLADERTARLEKAFETFRQEIGRPCSR